MRERIINFETSKLAKTCGFVLNTVGSHTYDYYKDNGELGVRSWGHLNLDSPAAVSQSLLQKWLREKHDIEIFVLPSYRKGKCGYDSYLRTGYHFEITFGECNFLMWCDFNNHIETDWEDSNSMEKEEDQETLKEYLDRIGKSIHKTYEEALEAALVATLKTIKNKVK